MNITIILLFHIVNGLPYCSASFFIPFAAPVVSTTSLTSSSEMNLWLQRTSLSEPMMIASANKDCKWDEEDVHTAVIASSSLLLLLHRDVHCHGAANTFFLWTTLLITHVLSCLNLSTHSKRFFAESCCFHFYANRLWWISVSFISSVQRNLTTVHSSTAVESDNWTPMFIWLWLQLE